MERKLVVGADLALRHGALVSAAGEIIYTYTSLDGMDSTLESIYIRIKNIIEALPIESVAVIDWDRTIGSWGKGRSNSNVGTLLTLVNWGVGLLARESRKAQVHFVAPAQVRKALGLPPGTSKRDVHKLTAHMLPDTLMGTKFHKDADVRGDCKDAFLLARTFDITKLG